MKSGLKRILSIVLAMTVLTTTVLSNGVMVSAASETDNTADAAESQAAPVTEEVPQEPAENTPVQEESEQPSVPETSEEPLPETPAEETTDNTDGSVTTPPVAEEPVQEPEQELPEETVNTQTSYSFAFTDMKVTVNLDNPESIPSGAVLAVKPVFDQSGQTNPDAEIQTVYDNFKALFAKQAEEQKIGMLEYLSYAVVFEKDGQTYAPQGKVHVTLEFNDGLILSKMEKDASNVGIYYIDDKSDAQQLLLGTVAADKKSFSMNEDQERILKTAFETDGFTQFTIGTSHVIEEKTEEKPAPQEPEDTQETVNAVYENDEVKVTASYKQGVLPEDAELKADKVQDEAKLKEVEDTLREQAFPEEEDTLAGFLAYDIRFEKDGAEIEPDGQVDVTLEFKEAVKVAETENTASARTAEEETESAVSLFHLKEGKEDGVTVEEMSQANVETTSAEEVKKAEFAVGSFSVFVLTWTNKSGTPQSNITGVVDIHLVDMNGNDLVPGDEELVIEHDETKSNYPSMNLTAITTMFKNKNNIVKNALEGRHLVRAYVKPESKEEEYPNGVEFDSLHLWMPTNGAGDYIGYQVKKGNKNPYNLVRGDEIYIVYTEAEEPLRQIETLSLDSLIDLTVFDYTPNDYAEQQIGNGYQMNPKQGLVDTKLAENGMPFSLKTGKNLSTLFGKENTGNKQSYTADNLFYQDANGYYYYNSAENFAYFNKETEKFEVYNWIASADYNAGKLSRTKGNFFPFTGLADNTNVFIQYGMDSNGKLLHNLNTGSSKGTVNHGFGMKMEFTFVQPENGLINGKNMRFEFDGDDDVFVFIDGTLVLDIGGSHEIASGYIDFSTGEVVVKGAGNYTKTTSLKKIFDSEIGDKTFEDWSTHKLSFFYTDRGGASNCKIKFNIPAIPKAGVSVKKEITNLNDGAYSDVDFRFKLYVQDDKGSIENNGKKYSVQKNTPYRLYASDGTLIGEESTAEDGTFTLKSGQMASFEELAGVNKTYFVEETNVSQSEYDVFKITGTGITGDASAGNIIESETDGTCIVRSVPLAIGTNVYVQFNNTCSVTNLRELTIKKEMIDGQTSDKEFLMDVIIGGHKYTGTYRVTDGIKTEDKTAKNGVIILKAGETAKISSIPSGTSFKVQETKPGNQFKEPVYAVEGADNRDTEGSASGSVKLNQNSAVTVTNEEMFSKLTIRKTIDKLYDVNGDAIFTFKITGPNNNVFYHTFRFTADSGVTQQYTFENLPFGEYQVEELPAMRYEETSEGGIHRTVILDSEDGQTVAFTNNRTYEPNYSHTDVVVNKITVENGKPVDIKQDNLKSAKQEER